jgi:diguanylate cyclase (GGDEF)-like protein
MDRSRDALVGRSSPVSIEESLRHLIEASKAVLAVLEADRLLEVLMEKAVELTRADRGFLMLADESGGLRIRSGLSFDRAALDGSELISRSVAEEVFRTRLPIRTSDALGDAALRGRKSVCELQLRTILCAPLVAGDRAFGVLYVDSLRPRAAFESLSLEVFQALADLAAIALENARLYTLATTDAKTGLATAGLLRARLEEALARSARSGRPVHLVLIDLDHFKRVNDTYGHPAGDFVLREVAAILKSAVRGSDLAARFGGEEFALLLGPADAGEPGPPLDALALAERVRRAIAERPFVLLGGTGIRVTASLGVAALVGGPSGAADTLLEAADRCLYSAKGAGRDRVIGTLATLELAGVS